MAIISKSNGLAVLRNLMKCGYVDEELFNEAFAIREFESKRFGTKMLAIDPIVDIVSDTNGNPVISETQWKGLIKALKDAGVVDESKKSKLITSTFEAQYANEDGSKPKMYSINLSADIAEDDIFSVDESVDESLPEDEFYAGMEY